jgi:glycosyltransferase involved in cell wall biosynthesis
MTYVPTPDGDRPSEPDVGNEPSASNQGGTAPIDWSSELERLKQASQAEIDRVTTLHAERVKDLETDRWRLNERIEALETQNVELHAGFLEQARSLQAELSDSRRALAELQQTRYGETAETRRVEVERIDAARREGLAELKHQEARSDKLLSELLRSKDVLVTHALEHQQETLRRQGVESEQVAQIRRELMAELAVHREQQAVSLQQLLKAKGEVIALQQAHASELSAYRAQELERLESLRQQTAAQIAEASQQLLRAKDSAVELERAHVRELATQRALETERLDAVRRELGSELVAARQRAERAEAEIREARQALVDLEKTQRAESEERRLQLESLSRQLGQGRAEQERLQSDLTASAAELRALALAHADEQRSAREHKEDLERTIADMRRSVAEAERVRTALAGELDSARQKAEETRLASRAELERTKEEQRQAELRLSRVERELTARVADHDKLMRAAEQQGTARVAELAQLVEDKERELRERTQVQDAERHRLRQSLAALEREAQRYRQVAVDLESKVDRSERTLSFRLGYLLIHSPKSWQGMKKLPVELLGLHREAKQKRETRKFRPVEVKRDPQSLIDDTMKCFLAEGHEAAARYVETGAAGDHEKAVALTQLAKALRTGDPANACRLGQRAYDLEPLPFRAKWLAFLKYDCGQIRDSAALVRSLPGDFTLKASEKARVAQIEGLARVQSLAPSIPERAERTFEPFADSCLYVAASGLPFHVSGYTVRTHSLVRAIANTGWRVTPVLRPGYPADRGVEPSEMSRSHIVDGITYLHVPGPHVGRSGLDQFVNEAAAALAELALQIKPGLIHAASNHVNALPALIAARRVGIPFLYEVRGMWELTAATRNIDWEQSERFALERDLETLVARNADHVFALTEGLAEELVARGVARERITVARNSVDPQQFSSRRRDPELMLRFGLNSSSFSLVYAGSLVNYEGLEDLLHAIGLLVADGIDVTLVIAGDGESREALQRLATDLSIDRRVKFVGKLPPGEIPGLWSLADAAAFPRKPFRVCELVSPLKPLEPMVMGIPVVVSDVGALREMVRDDETGLVHRAGDVVSLADKLRQLARDPEKRQRLGRAAREAVLNERTWEVTAERIVEVYRQTWDSRLPDIVPLAKGRSSMTSEEKALLDERLDQAFKSGGVAAVRNLAERQAEGRSERLLAFCLLKAANCCQRFHESAASMALVRDALALEETPGTIRGAARALYAAGDFAGAVEVVDRLERALGTLAGKDDELAREVRGRQRLLAVVESRGPRTPVQPMTKGKSVYFLHFSLPYTSVGYATRSHGLLAGIRATGYDVRAYTRAGFPYDFKPELEGTPLPSQDVVDGITYHRLLEGGRRGNTESEYLLSSADACERVLRAEQPEIVHAASNYVTALPALIAARRLGLPFIYEIRGFWEITRSSRDTEFENSSRYALMRHFEGLVAREADHVFTLTSAMKEELVRRGVDSKKITLVHNGVDAERFVPLSPRLDLANRLGIPRNVPIVGYVGSLVDYEGLDDLVRASGELTRRGIDFRLLLVGDGAVMDDLKRLVAEEQLENRVILTGRVPHDEVEAYYSLVDICPFPRKPWEVCEMVSPLKPFEAMAMEKAVVVSSTHALTEIVDDGKTGLVFQKGNVGSLAATLERLILDATLRGRLARDGRAWALSNRTWREAGKVVATGYQNVRDLCSASRAYETA